MTARITPSQSPQGDASAALPCSAGLELAVQQLTAARRAKGLLWPLRANAGRRWPWRGRLALLWAAAGGLGSAQGFAQAPAAPVPIAEAPTAVTASLDPEPAGLVAAWQPWRAYQEHPLVAQIRDQGLLQVHDRERLLRDDLPADRALAALDSLGGAAMTRHAVERYLLVGIAGRLAVGPSGSARIDNLQTSEASARHSLLLGWARALRDAGQPAKLLVHSDKLQSAGAVQLLELAAKKAPTWQVATVAAALARAEADPRPGACQLAKNLDKAMRFSGQEALRLAAAERVQGLALALATAPAARCGPELAQKVSKPIQLPPAKAEAAPKSGRAPAGDGHVFGDAFATAAPVFRGWLSDPLVKKLAMRTPLDDVALAEAIKTSANGDTAVAALNASLHNRRIGVMTNADVAWWAVLRSLGLSEADKDQQNRLTVAELSGVQALTLGYGYALGGRNTELSRGTGLAKDTPPRELLEYARTRLPMDALLGPLMAQAHLIDLDRQTDRCKAARRAEALRAAIGHGSLPDAAKQAMTEALVAVEKACPAAPVPVPAP